MKQDEQVDPNCFEAVDTLWIISIADIEPKPSVATAQTYLHTQIRPTVEADVALSAFDNTVILLDALPILKYLSSQHAGS